MTSWTKWILVNFDDSMPMQFALFGKLDQRAHNVGADNLVLAGMNEEGAKC